VTVDRITSWGARVVRFSPLEMLLLGALVILGNVYVGFEKEYTLAAFTLGILLSPVAFWLYKSGRGALTPSFLSGLALFAAFIIVTRLARVESGQGLFVGGAYAGICLLFGVSVPFTILRRRLLRDLEDGEQRKARF
jgi:hypothetical protein